MEKCILGIATSLILIAVASGCSSTQSALVGNTENTSGIKSHKKATKDDRLLTLEMPKESQDGSFVIKLKTSNIHHESGRNEVELWRNYNGSRFELVSTQPIFKAISQSVNREGTYGYQVKLKNNPRNHRIASPNSETSYINVKLRFPEISALSYRQKP